MRGEATTSYLWIATLCRVITKSPIAPVGIPLWLKCLMTQAINMCVCMCVSPPHSIIVSYRKCLSLKKELCFLNFIFLILLFVTFPIHCWLVIQGQLEKLLQGFWSILSLCQVSHKGGQVHTRHEHIQLFLPFHYFFHASTR